MSHQLAGGFRADLHIRDLELDGLQAADGAAKLNTLAGVFCSLINTPLGQADGNDSAPGAGQI